MFIVLSGVQTANDEPTSMEAYKAATRSLAERIGNDSLYEKYMNGLVDIKFDGDGNVVSVSDADDGYDDGYGYDDLDDVRYGSSVC